MTKEIGNIYTFMANLTTEGVAESVDALTLTAVGIEGKLSMSLVIDAMGDYLDLQEKKPFKFRRAKGWTRGGVSYADELKADSSKLWSILMVKGDEAEVAFTAATKLSDLKVTRLDIAVDILLTEQVLLLPRKLKDTYLGKFPVQLIESFTGDTLYVGSRESGMFIRIYDKSEEYAMALGLVWRFEVEFKYAKAQHIFELLKKDGVGIAADIVWTALRSREIPSPKIGQAVNLKARKVSFSTAELKLAWLGRQVRPTVDYLRMIGKEEEVYRQLGFEYLD